MLISGIKSRPVSPGLRIDPYANHRGSTKHHVQCVHGKRFTDDVTAKSVACAHCGTLLLVGEHFSRRFGAVMGVRIDAEAPDEPVRPLGKIK